MKKLPKNGKKCTAIQFTFQEKLCKFKISNKKYTNYNLFIPKNTQVKNFLTKYTKTQLQPYNVMYIFYMFFRNVMLIKIKINKNILNLNIIHLKVLNLIKIYLKK